MPDTRFAVSGERRIAYQVVGEGQLDLVYVAPWSAQVDSMWELEPFAAFLGRLASFSRLIVFDGPGAGASDALPPGTAPTMEQWAGDVGVVMDQAGSRRAAVLGAVDGGLMALMFAATHPERVSALVLAETAAYLGTEPGYPGGFGAPPEVRREVFKGSWGSADGEVLGQWLYPSLSPGELRALGRIQRLAASPAAAGARYQMIEAIDLRPALPAIRVPTLVLHRRDDRFLPIGNGRYLAQRIGGARFVPLEGADCSLVLGGNAEALEEIEEFLTGVRPAPDPDRVLATLLFTDIVDSTGLAASLGDQRWQALLGQHHRLVREHLARFRGREIDTAGDGFFATFDGPARAIRCALAIRDGVHAYGLTIRAGLHTGEVELMGEKVGGIAVHTGARVAAHADPDEVVVSRTVVDLVAGSGIEFEDRGEHQLKGLPRTWRLYAVIRLPATVMIFHVTRAQQPPARYCQGQRSIPATPVPKATTAPPPQRPGQCSRQRKVSHCLGTERSVRRGAHSQRVTPPRRPDRRCGARSFGPVCITQCGPSGVQRAAPRLMSSALRSMV